MFNHIIQSILSIIFLYNLVKLAVVKFLVGQKKSLGRGLYFFQSRLIESQKQILKALIYIGYFLIEINLVF